MGEYYGNNDWRDYKTLKHYGIKGMKWRKRKKSVLGYDDIDLVSSDRKKGRPHYIETNKGVSNKKYYKTAAKVFGAKANIAKGKRDLTRGGGTIHRGSSHRTYQNTISEANDKRVHYQNLAYNSSRKTKAKRAVSRVINSIKYRKKREKNKYGKQLKSNKRMYVKNIG